MNQELVVMDLPGAQDLIALFGRWPSFHDAEVTEIELRRSETSKVKIHTFATLNRTDARGHYVTEKHTIVTFLFDNVCDTELLGFSKQNVISCLIVEKVAEGYKVVLGGCWGVEGFIVAAGLRLEMERGIPPHSIYARESESTAATL